MLGYVAPNTSLTHTRRFGWSDEQTVIQEGRITLGCTHVEYTIKVLQVSYLPRRSRSSIQRFLKNV